MSTPLRLMKVILLCGALSLVFPIQAEAQRQPRKKVGLVLSGGGAKGVAHIGVLKVLEEAGIPIDYIAGTSMGAIVGGLYCIGYSPDALDSLVRAQNWLNLLADKIARDNLLFMEKEVNDKALLTIPFDRDRFYISTGILSGSSVMDMLSELTRDYHNISTFDSLPIPFACIGYDLLSGDEVVMREGSLPVAIRASMSIPGAFSTVERDGKILIDGGVINNFPADVVKGNGRRYHHWCKQGTNVDERTELSKIPDRQRPQQPALHHEPDDEAYGKKILIRTFSLQTYTYNRYRPLYDGQFYCFGHRLLDESGRTGSVPGVGEHLGF